MSASPVQLVWRLISQPRRFKLNGKVRAGSRWLPTDADALEQAAFADEKVIASLAGKTPK